MDLLAQLDKAHQFLLIGIGFAGAGTGIGGLIWWIIGRSIKKAISHPDDQTVHLQAGMVYVTAEGCEKMHEKTDEISDIKAESIRGELASHKQILCEHSKSISKIHERIDAGVTQHHNDMQKILLAIQKRNGGR